MLRQGGGLRAQTRVTQPQQVAAAAPLAGTPGLLSTRTDPSGWKKGGATSSRCHLLNGFRHGWTGRQLCRLPIHSSFTSVRAGQPAAAEHKEGPFRVRKGGGRHRGSPGRQVSRLPAARVHLQPLTLQLVVAHLRQAGRQAGGRAGRRAGCILGTAQMHVKETRQWQGGKAGQRRRRSPRGGRRAAHQCGGKAGMRPAGSPPAAGAPPASAAAAPAPRFRCGGPPPESKQQWDQRRSQGRPPAGDRKVGVGSALAHWLCVWGVGGWVGGGWVGGWGVGGTHVGGAGGGGVCGVGWGVVGVGGGALPGASSKCCSLLQACCAPLHCTTRLWLLLAHTPCSPAAHPDAHHLHRRRAAARRHRRLLPQPRQRRAHHLLDAAHLAAGKRPKGRELAGRELSGHAAAAASRAAESRVPPAPPLLRPPATSPFTPRHPFLAMGFGAATLTAPALAAAMLVIARSQCFSCAVNVAASDRPCVQRALLVGGMACLPRTGAPWCIRSQKRRQPPPMAAERRRRRGRGRDGGTGALRGSGAAARRRDAQCTRRRGPSDTVGRRAVLSRGSKHAALKTRGGGGRAAASPAAARSARHSQRRRLRAGPTGSPYRAFVALITPFTHF